MAKKEEKKLSNSPWFPHDLDASTDLKLAALLAEYSAAGYGIFWHIIELMHAEPDGFLPLKNYVYTAIADRLKVEVGKVESLVKACVNDYDLFTEVGGKITSNRVQNNLGRRQEVKDQAKEAAKIRWEKYKKTHNGSNADALQTHSNSNTNGKQKHNGSNATPMQSYAEERRGEEILSVGESISDILSHQDSNGDTAANEPLWVGLVSAYPVRLNPSDWKLAVGVWNMLDKNQQIEALQDLEMNIRGGYFENNKIKIAEYLADYLPENGS